MAAAALQYVRKVSGLNQPSPSASAAFEQAVVAVTEATRVLLAQLPARGAPLNRETEAAKARARNARRFGA